MILKWEADYKHVGRAFGRVGVWSKREPPVNVSQHASNKASPAAEQLSSRRPTPVRPSGFLNLFMRDFEKGDEDEDCRPVISVCDNTPTINETGVISRTDARGQWPMTRSLKDPLTNNLQMVDPHLLAYYLHRVCALTVPSANYATESPFSALLFPFSLSCSSMAIMEALLGLAASHWSRFDKTYRRVALAYYRKTLGSLRTLLATKTAAEMAMDPEILALMMLLCQHELIKDGESSWVVHLRGARDLISFRRQQQQQQLPSEGKALARQRPHPWEQITVFAERFFAFYDVMGRTACGEEPMFGNDFWSTQEDQVDPWMGCSPRLVSIISTITELSWKHHRQIQSHDEQQEVAEQRNHLEASLQQLNFDNFESNGAVEEDTMRRCVLLKRLTVDLYLHSALADTTPLTPAIKITVQRILRLVFDLQRLGIRAGLTWPLFMAACQLDPSEDMELEWTAEEAGCNDVPHFARPFILHALDQLSDSLSNVSRTRAVIEKVWRRREVACHMAPGAHAAEGKGAFNDWARFVAPLCHNVSVV